MTTNYHEYCRSLLFGEAKHINDGKLHEGPSRAIPTGYYDVLTEYDEATRTFNGNIPASMVADARRFELAQELTQLGHAFRELADTIR